MYMREAGKSVKIMLVAIDKEQSAIIRATFNPEKLAEFINDPKVFGVSLNDSDQRARQTPGKARKCFPRKAKGGTEKGIINLLVQTTLRNKRQKDFFCAFYS